MTVVGHRRKQNVCGNCQFKRKNLADFLILAVSMILNGKFNSFVEPVTNVKIIKSVKPGWFDYFVLLSAECFVHHK